MSLVPQDNEPRPRESRDVLAEMQAREMLDVDSGQPESVDLLGPLLRRKSIIILFALIASAIGYLMYRKENPTYQSALRIMIFSKNPPTVLNGETTNQGVSVPKQQYLITSELVLSKAVERGKLSELETFRGNPSPMYQLKGMIGVNPAPQQTDSLDITCRGAKAEDLPVILVAVVESYKRSLNDDTINNGQESIDLFEKLQQQLLQDTGEKKTKYYQLLEKLGLSAEGDTGDLKNQYLELKRLLESEKHEREQALSRVNERLTGLIEASKAEGELRAETLRSVSIEAEKYLSLGSNFGSANTLFSESANKADQDRQIQGIIYRINEEIESVELSRALNTRQYGENHPYSIRNQIQLDTLKKKLESAVGQQTKLHDIIELEKKSPAAENGIEEKNGQVKVNLSSIKIYDVTLRREKLQHESAIASLNDRIQSMDTNATIIRSEMAELNFLKDEIKEKESSIQTIMDKLTTISVVAQNFNATRVSVIDNAQNGIIVAPILRNYLIFSILIGALIGAGLAILIDRADLTFRNPYEIFQKMKVPVICKIPTLSKAKGKNEFGCASTLVTALDPRSSGAEAFRACRTAIMFFSSHSGAKVFLFSSPSAGDGKSTTVSNLAVSLAQSGKRVVILDADMRRPRQHKYFGNSMKPGMIGMLDGKTTIDEIIRPTFQENLSMVTCGGHPTNPGEFVVSTTFRDVLQGLRERFDFILIDSPPLLPVADATSLSTQVDGVILVFRIRKGIVLASQKARELLDLVHARILGIIVNGVDQNPYYNEYGGYGYPSHAGYAASRYYERQTKEYAESGE